MKTLVTIHGLGTRSEERNWQDNVSDVLQVTGLDSQIRHMAFKYPYIGAPLDSPTIPKALALVFDNLLQKVGRKPFSSRQAAARVRRQTYTLLRTTDVTDQAIFRFTDSLVKLGTFSDDIHIVAHSLGCHIAMKALENLERDGVPLRISSIRLMAAPLRYDYDFNVVSNVARYFAEYSDADDLWLDVRGLALIQLFFPWLVPNWTDGFRVAALHGFQYLPANGVNRFCRGFEHSTYVESKRLIEAWLPDMGLDNVPSCEEVWSTRLAPIARKLVLTNFLPQNNIGLDELRGLIEAVEDFVLDGELSPDGVRLAVGELITDWFIGNYQ